jgi:hypothetical protein
MSKLEKIFDGTDWVPLVGGLKLLARAANLPYEIKTSRTADFYIWANGAYNFGIVYGLIYLAKRALNN